MFRDELLKDLTCPSCGQKAIVEGSSGYGIYAYSCNGFDLDKGFKCSAVWTKCQMEDLVDEQTNYYN